MIRIKLTNAEEHAQKLYREAGITTHRVDPFEIVLKLKVTLQETTLPPKVWGSTIKKPQAIILLSNSIDNTDRRRFTLAHELGHLRMPHHQNRNYECFYWDIGESRTKDGQEREANEFAAELLMPSQWFAKDAENEDLTAEAAQRLAKKYEVSLSSAASKMAKYSYGLCATILIKDEKVSYCSRSQEFEEKRFYIEPGMDVPPTSSYRDILNREDFTIGSQVKTYPDVWIKSDRLEKFNGKIMEQAIHMPRYNSGLVLISFEDDVEEDVEED